MPKCFEIEKNAARRDTAAGDAGLKKHQRFVRPAARGNRSLDQSEAGRQIDCIHRAVGTELAPRDIEVVANGHFLDPQDIRRQRH